MGSNLIAMATIVSPSNRARRICDRPVLVDSLGGAMAMASQVPQAAGAASGGWVGGKKIERKRLTKGHC